MNKFMQMTGIGILTLGLGLSTASAMTEVEARAAVSEHAKASKWEDKHRTGAVNALNKLIQDGVPVDKAYAVVNACIDKGIRGSDLAKIAKDIDTRMDKGVSAETAVKDAMSRIELHATHDGRDQARDIAREQTREQTRAHGGMGSGYGAGAGSSEMGSGAGSGQGTGR